MDVTVCLGLPSTYVPHCCNPNLEEYLKSATTKVQSIYDQVLREANHRLTLVLYNQSQLSACTTSFINDVHVQFS